MLYAGIFLKIEDFEGRLSYMLGRLIFG